jgi:hypothetical protein
MKSIKTNREASETISTLKKTETNLESENVTIEKVNDVAIDEKNSRKKKKPAEILTVVDDKNILENESVSPGILDKGVDIDQTRTSEKNRLPILAAVFGGLLVGFLLGFFLFAVPLQNQLANLSAANSNGNSSSNLMKSDLSTTKLKQQEMEIRYQAVSDQLESANQYIFLLRMKEQISFARLMVEQKDGVTARQALSEIQSRYDHLKPFVTLKDPAAAVKIDELLKVSVQHLASDPDAVKSDLIEISDLLNKIETTLFQPE